MLLHQPIAAFRVIPYFACEHIDIPPLEELLDVSINRLQQLENTTEKDPKELLDEDDDQVLAENDD